MSLKNPSLSPGIRLPIEKVPLKDSTPLSPIKVSTDKVKGSVAINQFNYGYLSRLGDFKYIACQTRSNHNKGELAYVPESLLERYHKTLKVSIEIYHTTCIFIKYDQTIK